MTIRKNKSSTHRKNRRSTGRGVTRSRSLRRSRSPLPSFDKYTKKHLDRVDDIDELQRLEGQYHEDFRELLNDGEITDEQDEYTLEIDDAFEKRKEEIYDMNVKRYLPKAKRLLLTDTDDMGRRGVYRLRNRVHDVMSKFPHGHEMREELKVYYRELGDLHERLEEIDKRPTGDWEKIVEAEEHIDDLSDQVGVDYLVNEFDSSTLTTLEKLALAKHLFDEGYWANKKPRPKVFDEPLTRKQSRHMYHGLHDRESLERILQGKLGSFKQYDEDSGSAYITSSFDVADNYTEDSGIILSFSEDIADLGVFIDPDPFTGMGWEKEQMEQQFVVENGIDGSYIDAIFIREDVVDEKYPEFSYRKADSDGYVEIEPEEFKNT